MAAIYTVVWVFHIIMGILHHLASPCTAQELIFRNTNPADEVLRSVFGISEVGLRTSISSVDSSVAPGESCFTANQQAGLCLRVSQCPAYIPLVKEIQRPAIFSFFKAHICRLEVTNVRICCAVNSDLANLPALNPASQSPSLPTVLVGFTQSPPSQNQGSQISIGEASSSSPSQHLPIMPSSSQPSQQPFQNRPNQAFGNGPNAHSPSSLFVQNAPSIQNAQKIFAVTQNPLDFITSGMSGQRPSPLPVVPPVSKPLLPSQHSQQGPFQENTNPGLKFVGTFPPDRQSDQDFQDGETQAGTRKPISSIIPIENECGQASFVTRSNGAQTWPWLVAVGNKPEGDTFRVACGGALISRRHVITAAHCMTLGKFGTPTHVRLGDYDLERSNDLANPQDLIIKDSHSAGFNPSTFEKDIAILTLSQDVEFSEFMQPICLPYRFIYDGFRYQALRITGWSRTLTSKGRDNIPLTPQVFEAPVIGLGDCKGTYQRNSHSVIIDRRNLCSAGGNQEACLSDTSAPAVFFDEDTTGRYFLVGLASFGFGCDQPTSPVVYTRIGAFLDWIEQTVQ